MGQGETVLGRFPEESGDDGEMGTQSESARFKIRIFALFSETRVLHAMSVFFFSFSLAVGKKIHYLACVQH